MVISAVTEFCAECCSSRALQRRGVSWGSACGLFEARECCGFEQGDGLSAQCCGEFRGASAWWCGTGGGSGPQHGRPDGVMAPSDSAQFLAAGLEPVQWLPGSDKGKPNVKATVNARFKFGVHIQLVVTHVPAGLF